MVGKGRVKVQVLRMRNTGCPGRGGRGYRKVGREARGHGDLGWACRAQAGVRPGLWWVGAQSRDSRNCRAGHVHGPLKTFSLEGRECTRLEGAGSGWEVRMGVSKQGHHFKVSLSREGEKGESLEGEADEKGLLCLSWEMLSQVTSLSPVRQAGSPSPVEGTRPLSVQQCTPRQGGSPHMFHRQNEVLS